MFVSIWAGVQNDGIAPVHPIADPPHIQRYEDNELQDGIAKWDLSGHKYFAGRLTAYQIPYRLGLIEEKDIKKEKKNKKKNSKKKKSKKKKKKDVYYYPCNLGSDTIKTLYLRAALDIGQSLTRGFRTLIEASELESAANAIVNAERIVNRINNQEEFIPNDAIILEQKNSQIKYLENLIKLKNSQIANIQKESTTSKNTNLEKCMETSEKIPSMRTSEITSEITAATQEPQQEPP